MFHPLSEIRLNTVIFEKETFTQNKSIVFNNNTCKRQLRRIDFKNKKCIILSAKFKIDRCNKNEIDYCITKTLRDKKEKQPVSSFSFGCTFKNVGNISAWKYVKEVENSVKQSENVYISDKHASFIINRGEGSFKEVYNLIESIKNSVYYIYNIKLFDEVEIIDWR